MSTHAGEDDQDSPTMVVKIQIRGRSTEDCELWDDGAYSDVKRILIHHGDEHIHSVQIEYIDENGEPIWGAQHGENEGSTDTVTQNLKMNQVELDYPNEYLTSIHGYYSDDERVKSMTFESNTKTWGPYGKEDGSKFSFPIFGAKIVGFHGSTRWSSYLSAIGVYVTPVTNTKSKPALKPPVLKPQPEHFSLGIYGRDDGESWSETFRAVKRFVIYHDDEWIISIQMEYVDENGKSVLSKKHGGDGGIPKEVVLEYPDEYLITIEGYYDNSLDSNSASSVIRSLTVVTNKKTHEPIGVENGTMFKFPSDGRLRVVGIHGRSDSYLNAIGIHAVLI